MNLEEENWRMRKMESKRLSHHSIQTINPCINRALSGKHVLLIGSTGSGKTYAASYMAQFLDSFVFVNTQRELSVTNMCQVSLDDPSELQEAFEEGYRMIEYVPSMSRDEARDEIQTLREQIFEIGEVIKEEAHVLELPMWITVFLDEAQVYAPLHTHLDGEIFWTQGRGMGIRGIAISRQPQELSKEIVNNVEYELIFELGHYAFPYFKTFKIPVEEHEAWLARKHHFLLYDKHEILQCEPIS